MGGFFSQENPPPLEQAEGGTPPGNVVVQEPTGVDGATSSFFGRGPSPQIQAFEEEAKQAAEAAAASAEEAEDAATAAAGSAQNALNTASGIETSVAVAVASKNEAQASAALAEQAVTTTQNSAAAAATSAGQAATSATNAQNSASGAANSSSQAASSAQNAAASAGAAASSANNIQTAANTATTKAVEAATSATQAASSATAAAGSATSAASSVTASSTNASNAAASATTASTAATTATTKSEEAATSATSAAGSATAAAGSATGAAGSATTATTKASEAASSATAAAGSATTATTKASEAASSATAAAGSATTATTKAAEASTSATSATGSATTATTKASEAAGSATNAANSATAAAGSATAAAGSASSASSSASSASGSASSAASAQTAAESARDATLAAFDSFDDRYLGVKASDPSVDNDGNALVAGALYFNSTTGEMRVYTGTAWAAAYVSGAGVLLISNNLSDVANVASARTNLGLATVAASGAYADLTGRPTAVSAFSNDAGYLTSFTEADPTVPSHVKAITTTNISNWDTAFSWGNHASAGYLTGITSSQVTTALGFTPYNATNPAGYISGITSGNVTTALGYTPASTSGPTFSNGITVNNGGNHVQIAMDGNLEIVRAAGGAYIDFKDSIGEDFDVRLQASGNQLGISAAGGLNLNGAAVLTGITSGQVTTALGYTPYNATNPSGYITSSGSITGSAGSISGFNNPTTAPTANTIAYRDSLGDIAAREIILSSGLSDQTPSVLVSMYPATNQLVRTTPAAVAASIRGNATGTWSINVTGSAATATKANDLNQARYANTDFNTLGATPEVFRAYSNYIPSGGSYNQPPNGAGDYKVIQWGGIEGVAGNWGGQIVQNFYDDRMWFRRSVGTTWQAWREFIHDGNYTNYAMPIGSSATNSVDVRAPIFYDTPNTGYYLDPSNNSFIYGLSINVGQEGTGAANSSVQGLVMRGNYNSNTWAHKFHKFDNGGGVPLYLSATVGDGVWTARQGWGSGLPYTSQVFGSFGADTLYSAIFYDTPNTAFYVDPSSGSRMGSITLDSGNVLGAAVTFNNMNNEHGTYTDANLVGDFGFRYLQGATNGPNISGASQYYGMTVGLGNNYGFDLYASQFYWPRTALGGLPYPSVRYRENGTWGSWTKIYAGWADAPSGAVFAATGDFRAPVFYDSPNTAFYLDPDGTSRLSVANVNFLTLLNDEGLNVKGIRGQFSAGSDGCGISLFSNVDIGYPSGWGSGLGNTPSRGLSVYGGLRVAYSGSGFITCDTSVRAPIFYDTPDTGFYVDPSSTSNLSGLAVGSRISGSISGDAQRLFNHTGANNDGLQYWNTVGNDTLNPNTGWHYAIRMGHGDADTYYSATIAVDFFNDNVWLRRKGGGANQPWKRFALYDNVYEAILYASSFSDANNTAFFLDPNNTGTSLNVAGSIVAAGNVTAYSDIRIKANVETIPSALDKLDQIRGVTYTRTDLDDKEQRYAGVIAQEIEAVLPEAVRDLGDIKAVDYNATIALLIQAVKELQIEVETVKSRLH